MMRRNKQGSKARLLFGVDSCKFDNSSPKPTSNRSVSIKEKKKKNSAGNWGVVQAITEKLVVP